jgi:hypothetical protein
MSTPQPRMLRPVGPPLGSYLRPGRDGHTTLLRLLAEGAPDGLSGIVFDACLLRRHGELRSEVRRATLEAILDPRTVELGTLTGSQHAGCAALPWAQKGHQSAALASDLRKEGRSLDEIVRPIVASVVSDGFSAVLAPTHYVESSQDAWLDVDAALTERLREGLDRAGRAATPIYYVLAVHASCLNDPIQRLDLIERLQSVPIDALWLRVHPFGSASGPLALRRYIEASRDLHRLRIPLVAERTGTVGLALMAFGGVSGVEGGLTIGERFDAGPLLRPPRPNTSPFSRAPRVYLPALGVFVERKQAERLFQNRQMKSALMCRDSGCCRNGTSSTIEDPRRHFLLQRAHEVADLSRVPETTRPTVYLENFLRPASDLVTRAAKLDGSLSGHRQRLEGWRTTLGKLAQTHPPATFAPVPQGERARRQRASNL